MTESTNSTNVPLSSNQKPIIAFWYVFKRNKLALTGLTIFILFFLLATSGLILTSGKKPVLDPAQVRLQEKLLPPLSKADQNLSKENKPFLGRYILGTDELGRDVFARMLQGAWVSMTVGFVAVGISVLIGIIMGSIAGFFGPKLISFHALLKYLFLLLGFGFLAINITTLGSLLISLGIIYWLFSYLIFAKLEKRIMPTWLQLFNFTGISVDTIIMRFVDIMLCFPSFFLILTVIAILPPSIYNIMIVIGLTSWMGTARFVRAEFLSLREQDFVTAVRALGLSNTRIIFKHMLPNAIAPVLVSATIGIATAILTEAGLSFLGFGVPPPQATWGNILSEGKRFLFDAPWLTIIPGIAILIVVLAFNLFGEGLRDALNPKLRGI